MKKYGLIGFPLEHSFSKTYFDQKFKAEKIDAQYVNFETRDVKEVKRFIRENPELSGLNVTLPHKVAIMSILDSVDATAKEIGAVNVIKFKQDIPNKLHLEGYNTDATSFMQSIQPLLSPTHKKALILSTGGSAKSVYYGLKRLGVTPVYVSRTKKNNECFMYGEEITEAVMKEFTVIVNTTPAGMYPSNDECPDIPYEWLTENHLLFDLLYNPEMTVFMRKGAEMGAKVKNGMEMLLLQAFASWQIWNK